VQLPAGPRMLATVPDKIPAQDPALKMAEVKRHEQRCDNIKSREEATPIGLQSRGNEEIPPVASPTLTCFINSAIHTQVLEELNPAVENLSKIGNGPLAAGIDRPGGTQEEAA
jgi:hypothetical protein